MDRRHVVLGLVCSLFVAAWILAGPYIGLPFGVFGSTGESMGDDGMMLNVWIDAEPEVGDVVAFDMGTDSFTHDRGVHRVVGETDRGYVTKGDANPYLDQNRGADYVTDSNLIGVVVLRVSLPIAAVPLSTMVIMTLCLTYYKNERGVS